jgi:hypothetical protein
LAAACALAQDIRMSVGPAPGSPSTRNDSAERERPVTWSYGLQPPPAFTLRDFSVVEAPAPRHDVGTLGARRELPDDITSRGVWQLLPGGSRVWRLGLRSPGAWGIIARLNDFHVGEGRVWIYSPGAATGSQAFLGPFTGDGTLSHGVVSSPIVAGDSVVIEYAPPSSAADDALPFSGPWLYHLFSQRSPAAGQARLQPFLRPDLPGGRGTEPLASLTSPSSPFSLTPSASAANASCSYDATCQTDWAPEESGIVQLSFTDAGGAMICTGSLLTDAAYSGAAFMLTANHCISDQATADTLVIYFYYQTSTCNGTWPPSYSLSPNDEYMGGTLLTHGTFADGDFSFLQLTGAAPGATRLGWSTFKPAPGAYAVTLHHPGTGTSPASEPTRFSTGTVAAYQDIEAPDGSIEQAGESITLNFILGQGFPEKGSSGAPLFDPGSKGVIGLLSLVSDGQIAGAPCNTPNPFGTFPQFGAYFPSIGEWIGCSYAVTFASTQFPWAGGSLTVTVQPTWAYGNSINTQCPWKAFPNADWLTVDDNLKQGPGSVDVQLTPNPDPVLRQTTFNIAGKPVTVEQLPYSCKYTLSSPSDSVPYPAGSGSFVASATDLATGQPCPFEAQPADLFSQTWLTVTGIAKLGTSYQVTYSYSANGNGSRYDQIALVYGGKTQATFIVNQAGAPFATITVPATLPNATVGQPYSYQFTYVGGTPPYTWEYWTDAGPLPPGLTFAGSGLLSGTPTTPGTYIILIVLSPDSPNYTQIGNDYTINVVAANPVTLTLSPTTNGSIQVSPLPANGLYTPGTSVTLTAVPATGFTFSSWTGALAGATNPAVLVMDSNGTVGATFTSTQAVIAPRDFGGNSRSGDLLYDPAIGTAYTALSNGDGTFQYVYNLFQPAFDFLRTGDFNGDHKADLVVYNSKTSLAYIGFGKGDGTFNFQSLFWSPGYTSVEAGDLNGDGRTDFVLYNAATGTTYSGLSDGSGNFTYKYTLVSAGFTYLRLADFTGDGKADLFLYNSTNGAAYLGVGDGLGGFAFHALFMSSDYDYLDVGDLNGDGKADLIAYNSSNGNTASGLSDGAGGFSFKPLIFQPGFTSIRLGDVTGDGNADVVVYNRNNAIGYFGTSDGAGDFSFQSLFWSPGYDFVQLQDLNGDGKSDVVLYNSTTGTAYTGIGNGSGAGGFTYSYSLWGPGKTIAR